MFRSAQTVEMLKPIALIAGLAILLWSLGLPSLRFAEAANITDVRDILSDSAPNAVSNHDIQFVSPTGMATSSTIVLTFPTSPAAFDLSGIGQEDIDLLNGASNIPAANWSVATTATTITITLDSTAFAAGATTTILIGLNATNEGVPDTQIVNPSAEASYEINIDAGASDSGATRVVILGSVLVSATVNTIFNFSVTGLTSATVNGESTTGAASTTTIPFGTLQANTASSVAQMLTVSTNAANGYSVTVQTDQPFQSSTGAIIDGFDNGSDTATPVAWGTPDGTVGSPQTYGHWGLTSDDSDIFAVANTFIAASTSPREVMTHNGPVNGAGVGQGTTSVLYKVQISALQEAGDDYTTTLTYVATPTF